MPKRSDRRSGLLAKLVLLGSISLILAPTALAGYCIEGQTVANQNGTVDFLLTNYCENPVEVQITPKGSTSGQICTKMLIPTNATRTYKQRSVCRSLNDINSCGCGGISWIEIERPSKRQE